MNVVQNPDPGSSSTQHRPFNFESGRSNFDKAHIPSAGFIDVPGDLSDQSSSLPLMMPPEEQLVESMRTYGINNDSHVVLYGCTEPNWAARVWWMLRSLGFDKVSILNGGWAKWQREGRPESNQPCTYARSNFSAQPRTGTFANKDETAQHLPYR